MRIARIHLLSLLVCTVIVPLAGQQSSMPLSEKIRRFAPTPITANTSALSEGDKKALAKLVEAAGVVDQIYLKQVWSGNPELLDRLRQDNTPAGQERLHYFMLNMGPWSKLDHDAPFIEGVPNPKPPGANYYPEDLNKDLFNSWVATLPADAQRQAIGFFWTIRRDASGNLYTNPYFEEYRDDLEQLARLLLDAAALTTNPSLKNFLTKRAAAFLDNEYYASDVAWMDLDSPIDVTIGPYETYMDELFNYKAAFEAFITIRNDEESRKLEKYAGYLQEIENNLPIDSIYRNPKLGALAPIRVVDEIVTGGEARPGVQTAAFNLPNDEKVVQEKGSKRVMLKNVQEAKFSKVLVPISRIAIDKNQQQLISFEPFFTHILAHELMHGLGPHNITPGGRATTVRQELKELYSSFEEAKADISGLFLLQYLIDKGVIDKTFEQQMYVTYLAGVFRSVRFGIKEAHGKGMALQFNYLTDEGAFRYDEATGTYSVDFLAIPKAMTKLTRDIMMVQAKGDYKACDSMLKKYCVIRPPMQKILDKLTDVPVDIEPTFSGIN